MPASTAAEQAPGWLSDRPGALMSRSYHGGAVSNWSASAEGTPPEEAACSNGNGQPLLSQPRPISAGRRKQNKNSARKPADK